MNLAGKIGLITGASSGIGYESAKHALKSGAKAIAITGQNPERLNAAQKSLSEFGQVSAYQWRADVTEVTKHLQTKLKINTVF